MLHAEDIAALMGARHPDPCAVLGMQERDGQIWVHALLPGALGVDLLDRTSGRCVAGLQRLAGSEVFGVRLARRRLRFDYLLRVQWPGPSDQAHPAPVLLEDPYRIGIVLGVWTLWQLGLGLVSPMVANMAHIGGLLAGALLGWLIVPRLIPEGGKADQPRTSASTSSDT